MVLIYKGIFPCFFAGLESRLFLSISSAFIKRGRVSDGAAQKQGPGTRQELLDNDFAHPRAPSSVSDRFGPLALSRQGALWASHWS